MDITPEQDYAIAFALGTFNYHKEKSEILFEAGRNVTDKSGREVFVGAFIVHLYRRGKFRFECKLEDILGKQFYSVDKEKIVAK
jgi:hypothetical protein